MNAVVNTLIREVILIEGGYVDNPSDSGGATKYGITEALARVHGYKGQMKDLTEAQAIAIYDKEFCTPLKIAEIAQSSLPVASELLDTAVNMGKIPAGRMLQRSLNALNFASRNQSLFEALVVDGLIGARTIVALTFYLKTYKTKKGVEALLKAMNCLQGARYLELTESREKDKEFFRGWLINRVNLDRI